MELEVFGTLITSWQIFVSIGLILMALEMVIPGFIVFPMGLAFLLTGAFVPLTQSLSVQLGILGVNLILVFGVLHRWNKRRTRKKVYLSNVSGMIGREVSVIEPISKESPGYVKLYGDQWQAISLSGQEFGVGEKVMIESLDGNKVIVKETNKGK